MNLTRSIAVLLAAILALLSPKLTAAAGAAAAEAKAQLSPREQLRLAAELSPEWVSSLPAAQQTEQLLIVAGQGGTSARVSLHEKDHNGQWHVLLSCGGFIGRNGLVPDAERWEGCGMTPIGVYGFDRAFGTGDDPGCAIPYKKVGKYDYWSGDGRPGMGYNRMVDIRELPDLDRSASEHLIDFGAEYRYCLNISFNAECTPGRGSAIFLHCTGRGKTYTGGCVAIPEAEMKRVMQLVSPDCTVVIDYGENLGAG